VPSSVGTVAVRAPFVTNAAVTHPAFLVLRDVTKRFGVVTAVDDVGLGIEDGELICFLGPSGCGKTTLLRLVAGLERPDSGTIVLEERDLASSSARQRNFGMVFQSYSLFPNMTVRKNIAYGLECRGWSRAEGTSRIDEMLTLVHLADQSDKYPSQLSGGQQQRVALARALAPKPHVLLLDEPLSALDAKVRLTLRGEVRKLQQSLGITTIMVTHDQEEALTMADRIVVMNEGGIEQVGTPDEIYRAPATSFVADFIGTMNFLRAAASANGSIHLGGTRLVCEHWQTSADEGAPVQLAFRPEDVRVAGGSRDVPNCLAARVDWVEFIGSTYRLDLVLVEAEQQFKMELSANVMREMSLRVGSSLSVDLPAEHLWVYRP
jgi:iron(III) transport system ATP-binding protein